jgi:hypothetical protein
MLKEVSNFIGNLIAFIPYAGFFTLFFIYWYYTDFWYACFAGSIVMTIFMVTARFMGIGALIIWGMIFWILVPHAIKNGQREHNMFKFVETDPEAVFFYKYIAPDRNKLLSEYFFKREKVQSLKWNLKLIWDDSPEQDGFSGFKIGSYPVLPFEYTYENFENWFKTHRYPEDGRPPLPTPTYIKAFMEANRGVSGVADNNNLTFPPTAEAKSDAFNRTYDRRGPLGMKISNKPDIDFTTFPIIEKLAKGEIQMDRDVAKNLHQSGIMKFDSLRGEKYAKGIDATIYAGENWVRLSQQQRQTVATAAVRQARYEFKDEGGNTSIQRLTIYSGPAGKIFVGMSPSKDHPNKWNWSDSTDSSAEKPDLKNALIPTP